MHDLARFLPPRLSPLNCVQYIRRQRKYLCHDPEERCRVGDLVMIKQHPNISKRKHFEVVQILEKSPAHLAEEQQQQQSAGSDTLTSDASTGRSSS